ncbi:MAG: HEPN domain-containing protein [Planctomycetota bacterium]
MLRSWAASVKLAEETNTVWPSTTTVLACRQARLAGSSSTAQGSKWHLVKIVAPPYLDLHALRARLNQQAHSHGRREVTLARRGGFRRARVVRPAGLIHGVHFIRRIRLGNLPEAGELPEKLFDCAKSLDKHYIPTRYPNGFDSGAPTDFYTKNESAAALDCAEKIIEYCKNQIQ